jgi:hypothetical protein
MKKMLLLIMAGLITASAVQAQRTKTTRRADTTGTGKYQRNTADSNGHYKNSKYYNPATDTTMRKNKP